MFTYNTLKTKLHGYKHYTMDFYEITTVERDTSLTNLFPSCYFLSFWL